jgi:predicted Zn-dependent protease
MPRAFVSLVLLSLVTSSGCAIDPVTGRPEFVLTSTAREREIGRQETEKLERYVGFADEQELVHYVEALGARLAAHSPRKDVEYRFHVVEMLEPNAFALPGGYVFVSRGLLALANSEDELANVIGHEIGHVAARHAVERQSLGAPLGVATGLGALAAGIVSPILGEAVAGVGRLASGLVLAPYSREQEREADRVGQEIAAAAGWDPAAMTGFLHTLEREEALRRDGQPRPTSFLASHPSTPERVETTRRHAREIERAPARPIAAGRARFLDRLDGLRVGPDPGAGFFIEGRFLHPDLDLTLRFPKGWKTQNARRFVAAGLPNEYVLAILEAVAEGNDPVAVARAFEKETEIGLKEEPRPLHIGNLHATRSTAQFRGKSLDLTWVAHRGLVFQITGVSTPAAFDDRRATFRGIAESFRPLTEEERAGVRVRRMRVARSKEGESVSRLVERTEAVWSPEETAVANGLNVEERLGAGHLVKVAMRERYRP